MMPFSVLRIWGLGIIAWLLLGAAVYCGWRAYDQIRRDSSILVVRTVPENERAESAENPPRQVIERRPADLRITTEAWWWIAGALGLLVVSYGGHWPVHWLLGNQVGPEPEHLQPTHQRFVDRPDGSRLHVQIYGSDTAPTLLLTHGWSLNVSTWDYLKRRLAERFRLVMWDLPGLGRSRGPNNGDYSIEKMARDLDAVIEATASSAPLILVGHSIGTFATQTLFRLKPGIGSRVQGVVLLHPTYINPLRTCFLSSLATALEWPLITPLNYLTIALAPLAWLSNWQSYYNGSLHISTRITSFSGKQTYHQLDHAARLAAEAWPGVLARGNLGMQRFDEERTLPSINVPTLLIAGQHDRMTRPDAADHMAELLPNDRPFRISGGHLGYWEQPDDVAEVIEEFAAHVIGMGEGAKETVVEVAPPNRTASSR